MPTVPENVVTATTMSTSECGIYDNSSEDSCGSDISDLEGKKLLPTTVKKKKKIEQSNLPITEEYTIQSQYGSI